jgi:hypothetical protein
VLLEAFLGQLEVESANEDLTLGVSKGNLITVIVVRNFFGVITVSLAIAVNYHVRVRLLDLLAVRRDVHLVPVAITTMLEVSTASALPASEVATTLTATLALMTTLLFVLVVFSRLDVDLLVKNPMAIF